MWCPLQGKIVEVGEGELGPSEIEVASREEPAEHRGDLEIDQFGSCQVFAAKTFARPIARATVVGQRDGKDTGVNDEHART